MSTALKSSVLTARGLSFSYTPSSPTIFEHFNHTFRAGTHTALTGRSGTGKSTLLYLLAGFMKPTSGQVLYGDVDVHTQPDLLNGADPSHRPFGFVFQQAELDPRRNALENVVEPAHYSGLPHDAATRRAMTLLEAVDLVDFATALPTQLSGGQCQRVAVARALVLQPAVVFADEPTGNLDATTADTVLDALLTLVQAPAVLIIATHDPRVVERASDVVHLEL